MALTLFLTLQELPSAVVRLVEAVPVEMVAPLFLLEKMQKI